MQFSHNLLLHNQCHPGTAFQQGRSWGRNRHPWCSHVYLCRVDSKLPVGTVPQLLHMGPSRLHLGQHLLLVCSFNNLWFISTNDIHHCILGFLGSLCPESPVLAQHTLCCHFSPFALLALLDIPENVLSKVL